MSGCIINVSNRLPVTVGEEIRKSSGGLVTALEGVSHDGQALKWVGWPGAAIEPDRQEALAGKLRDEFGYEPVFMSADEVEAFYEGFSNSSIWPLLHYMPTNFRYESNWWEAYQQVNQRFADAVLAIAKDGDRVWVHDYQLMLLPRLLRKSNRQIKIGFFLHTPFPSYEIFRIHPRRSELLEGLLGADLVGFHTFGYLRHFRSSVLRLLGIESEIVRIRQSSHTTVLGVYPIGINVARFEQALDSPEFRDALTRFRETYREKCLVLSVERLDYTKGILRRLDAIDLFLASHANRDEMKFVFVSVPSREGIEEYQALREEVEGRVGRINGKYATLNNSPIHFIHGSVEFVDLCAMYALADATLVTPLIDGMNLVAKESVAAQRDHAGVLILSEFAGAAEELANATLVNPFDAQAVADALEAALQTPPEERQRRMAPMRQRVMRLDAAHWAKSFLDDLAAAEPGPETVSSGPALLEARDRVGAALRSGKRVAFFLDYDGTLRELERSPETARPNRPLEELLERFTRVPNLHVTLISGRQQVDMQRWFGSSPFDLVAEHGAEVRRAGSDWEATDRNVSYAWKESVRKVLELYADSTPGSFVEEKRSGLVWHYRRADPDFGAWKANELVDELGVLLSNEPVQIRHGKKIVELSATQVSKGAAVLRLLEGQDYELVLCAGDDVTDESMFNLDAREMLTIKVGAGQTLAKLRVRDPAQFRDLLAQTLPVGSN